MESLDLLLPMSVLLVLALIGLFAWALHAGQFDDLEREGLRVLEEDDELSGPVASSVVPQPHSSSSFRQIHGGRSSALPHRESAHA